MKYTIDSVNDDGTVVVTFLSEDVAIPEERRTQTFKGLDLGDADNLKRQLSDNALAFEAGLRQEQVEIATAVKALVGQQQTVTEG